MGAKIDAPKRRCVKCRRIIPPRYNFTTCTVCDAVKLRRERIAREKAAAKALAEARKKAGRRLARAGRATRFRKEVVPA